jgi:transcriptional regulator with XRE-family HTH domain
MTESAGAFIYQCRSRKNMTQLQLAKLCGMGQGTISRLEHGTEPIRSVVTVMKLTNALGCSYRSILTRIQDDYNENTGGWRAR